MKLEHPEKSPRPQHAVSTPQTNRRKLVQVGLAGAPLLMALKSTPVLAANCKNPSGFSASGNLSRPNDYKCLDFQSLGLSYWVTWLNNHPADNVAFTVIGTPQDVSVTDLASALAKGQTNIHALAAAAYLNAVKTSGFPINAATLSAMWAQGVVSGGGGYKPIPNATAWFSDTVAAYLRYLLGIV